MADRRVAENCSHLAQHQPISERTQILSVSKDMSRRSLCFYLPSSGSPILPSLHTCEFFLLAGTRIIESGNLLKVSKTIGYLPRYPFQIRVDSLRLVRATGFESELPGFDAAGGRFRVDSKAFEPLQSENIPSETGKKVV